MLPCGAVVGWMEKGLGVVVGVCLVVGGHDFSGGVSALIDRRPEGYLYGEIVA